MIDSPAHSNPAEANDWAVVSLRKVAENGRKVTRFKRQRLVRQYSTTVDSQVSRVARTDPPGSFQAPHLLFRRGSVSTQGQVN